MFPLVASLLFGVAFAEEEEKGPFEVEGYVAPEFVALHSPDALPVDRNVAGLANAEAGVIFSGQPFEHWDYTLFLKVSPVQVPVVESVRGLDLDNEGDIDSLQVSTVYVTRNIVRQATVRYLPHELVALELGRDRIPFTAEAQWNDFELLLSNRATPISLFWEGESLGGTATVGSRDLVEGSVGLYNGGSGALGDDEAQGLLWAGRLDISPLGEVSNDPFQIDPFRFSVGGGVIYRPYTLYDSSGYKDVGVEDTRASASIIVRAQGLQLLAEGLRRTQTDTLTARPIAGTGGYAQASYLFLFGIQPLVRYGSATWDETFDERRGIWVDAGFNFFPLARTDNPDKVRVTSVYVSQNRVTEDEKAYGVAVQVQVEFAGPKQSDL